MLPPTDIKPTILPASGGLFSFYEGLESQSNAFLQGDDKE